MVMLDPYRITGITTPTELSDPRFGITGMAPAKELAAVAFPRSVLSAGQPYTRAKSLAVTRERIVVEVAENTDITSDVSFVYEFDFNLRLIAVTPGNGVKTAEAYRKMTASAGHPAELNVEAECERLKAALVVKRNF
jgi:uncharacterized protein with PIN domain